MAATYRTPHDGVISSLHDAPAPLALCGLRPRPCAGGASFLRRAGVNNAMPSPKCTEQIRVAVSDDLLLRVTKLASADNRALSEWVRHKLIIVCEMHDRGVDLSVTVPRRPLAPSDYY